MGSVAQIEKGRFTVGVDTHLDTHTAAVKDSLGRTVGETAVAATPAGYKQLLDWGIGYGEVESWGIEGTGSYGAGLARFLRKRGHNVVEVIRPDRSARRHKGKSDPVDAEAAARSVQAGEATGLPKAADGMVEVIRCLYTTRKSAVKARTQAINALKALVVTAPEAVREELRHFRAPMLVQTCCAYRPGEVADVSSGVRFALRSLARRCRDLTAEVKALDVELNPLVPQAAPTLCSLFGVGVQVAAQALITAGDNPGRLTTEARFAKLCGVAPLEASSGKTKRHRLNRWGDRQANCALYRVVIVRLRHDHRTQEYMARRLAEGKTKKEVLRCLKRYVAREIYASLQADQAIPAGRKGA
jgi:transposase